MKLQLSTAWEHRHLAETDSTMLALTRPGIDSMNCEFLLLTTDYQTAGRGQRGTHWESEPAANLLFGIRCCPVFLRADHQFALSEVQALAVAEALGKYVDGVRVKWPNDVYVGDRKICGMLLEHKLVGKHIATSITGVGINVNQRNFVSDAPNPISLWQLLGHNVDRAALMSDIAHRFEDGYRLLQDGDYDEIHANYLRHLYRNSGFHQFAEPGKSPFSAAIVDVRPDGMLELKNDVGHHHLYAFKEVTFLLE